MFRQGLRSSTSSFLRTSSASTSRPGASFGIDLARRWLSEQTRSQIQKAVESSPVVVFMKGIPQAPQCGFSRAVIMTLDLYNVPPEKVKTYNVLADPELRTGIKEFSEWPTIPQVYVNGEFIGGCDIVMGMHSSGDLGKVLEKANVIPPTEQEQSSTGAASTSSQ